jgi:predicted methyltransferase
MSKHLFFSHFQIKSLIDTNIASSTQISTDLGLTQEKIERSDGGYILPSGDILTDEQIFQILQDNNSCYRLVNGQLVKVQAYSERTGRYYTLMPTSKAPTMLISGIPMHRIKGTDPVEDTKTKIKALGNPYGKILDTAMGLGYTAILAAQSADSVITIEFDPAVYEICKLNPWSEELLTNPKIHKIFGDSGEIVKFFPKETFNALIHDPPTFSLAGHLYSQAIYQDFHRILKPNGRLFHYIGNPNSRYGATTGRGVVERLKGAGFRVRHMDRAFGVLAVK